MKNDLRKKYLTIRNTLDEQYIKKESIKIFKKVLNSEYYRICDNIFIFLSMKNEIDTKYFIQQCFKDNKKVCVPVFTNKKREMIFCEINDFSNLKHNKFGILEPIKKNIVECNRKTIIIVPGIVYSKDKFRVGYGGGFYDKFLTDNKSLINIGVCLDMFIIDKIDINKYDKNVDIIFTEKRII